MSVRAFDPRRIAACAAILVLAGLFVAAGCSDDKSNPTFPETPQPPVGTWMLGVWGSGPDDVWVVGQPGLIYHWDGSAWERQSSPTSQPLTSVWGDGTGTVYITGHKGVILRNNGGGWSRMESGTSANLFDVGSYQGTTMACGRNGVILRLSGSNWSPVADEVILRDPDGTEADTLYLRDEEDPNYVESFTSVANYGITGANGVILMEDPVYDWELRRVRGGSEWVTCSTSAANRLPGNFIATDGGRLYQLAEDEGRLVWRERFSPVPELDAIIYGLHADQADTVYAVTNDGRVTRVDPTNGFAELYNDGKVLFDIWGTSGGDLYAVGIDGRVLHRVETAPDVYEWLVQELPDLPETKSHAVPVFDKFGRPVP